MTTTAWQSPLGKTSGHFVAALYLILGLADLWFSLLAFRLGVPEGNPVLAWMGAHQLFIPAKLTLTVLATVLIATVYHRERARLVCWGAIVLMLLVDLYHIVALTARLGQG